MKDIRQKLLSTFQIEHRDHVEQIRSLLAMIEKTGGQPAGGELEEAFRRAHSLKGAARAVDVRPVEGLAHRMETLFSRVRKGALPLDAKVSGVVQKVLDASEDCMTALGENRPPPGVAAALKAIEQVLGMESEPIASSSEPATVTAAEPLPTVPQLEVVRITAQNFDGLLRTAGGLLSEGRRQARITEKLDEIVQEITQLAREWERVRRISSPTVKAGDEHPYVGPGLARLNRILSSTDRQVRSLSRHASAVRGLQRRGSWQLRHLGKQLQQDVWQARMVPAESLLEGYRKMMRDLARDEGKQIEFRAASAGVHADRHVLESLKDPLMHLLRNAVSHGIEPPAERASKGKPEAGLVTLRIDAKGQRLTIAIQDDGRGVDFSRVAEIARREGILSGAGVTPSRQDLTRVLFRPGFSTSSSVTPLAGRGMGLSVVEEAIRRLQGTLELRPAEGTGTLVNLSVPLAISTHRLLLIRCAGHVFAVPVQAVKRLYAVERGHVGTREGRPVVELSNESVPLVSLRQLLGIGESSVRKEHSETLHVLVMQLPGTSVAVAVDDFLRETEAVIQDLGPASRVDGKISSGALLEDGEVALVLNPAELLENIPRMSFEHQVDATRTDSVSRDSPAMRADKPPSILVVDDSMTTRMLEKSILTAHGYRVRVAVDGEEALALLRAEKADAVIADIEMPRLDGFGLIAAMKNDATLASIPVIVVSSLERREDKERGLRLGADAYIVKRKFDQEELLAAIRRIV